MTIGARILVAEDNELVQRMVTRALERAGYLVVGTSTKDELFSEIDRAPPDLIVLGLALPDQHSFAVLALLRNDPQTAAIPVVVSSGNEAESQRRASAALGAAAYVRKGPPSLLLAAIELSLPRRVPGQRDRHS